MYLQVHFLRFFANHAEIHIKVGMHPLACLLAGLAMEDASTKSILDRLMIASGSTTYAELADNLKLTKQTVAQARVKGVPPSWIPKAAKLFNVSTDWLFFGQDPVAAGESGGVTASNQDSSVDMLMVPLVEARLSAGQGSFQTDGKTVRCYGFNADFLYRKGQPASMVLMRVSGDSMYPDIRNNDIVLIDQSQKDLFPGRIYAVGFDEAIYIKRVDMLPGKVILKSANPDYPPVELDVRGQLRDSFRVIGQVLWSCREY